MTDRHASRPIATAATCISQGTPLVGVSTGSADESYFPICHSGGLALRNGVSLTKTAAIALAEPCKTAEADGSFATCGGQVRVGRAVVPGLLRCLTAVLC
jgi:hypothetical protein